MSANVPEGLSDDALLCWIADATDAGIPDRRARPDGRALRSAIKTLTASQKKAIQCKREGRSAKEMAARLGMTVEFAERTLEEARQQLRLKLGSSGPQLSVALPGLAAASSASAAAPPAPPSAVAMGNTAAFPFLKPLLLLLLAALTAVAVAWVAVLLLKGDTPAPPDEAHWQLPAQKALTAEEARLLARLRELVRKCATPEGPFKMMDDGAAMWVSPAWTFYAAQALLAGDRYKPEPGDRGLVGKALAWAAREMKPDGLRFQYTGQDRLKPNLEPDQTQAGPTGMFLVALERYRQAGGDVTAEMAAAADTAVAAIAAVTDGADGADGLVWSYPDSGMKYLADGIEARSGLRAAASLYRARGNADKAKDALARARKLSAGLAAFRRPGEKSARYAFALDADGDPQFGDEAEAYPFVMAQLLGRAHVGRADDPFAETVAPFAPEDTRETATGVERFLIAAARRGGADETAWRKTAAEAGDKFTRENVYVSRPAWLILGLLEGADWMPE